MIKRQEVSTSARNSARGDKKRMKNALIIILSLAIGVGLGYSIALGISYIVDGSEAAGGIDKMKMVMAVGIALVALFVSFFANTILHEAGHLVAGLMTGYRFLSFRIFNLTLQKEDDGVHVKKFGISGTLGQCLMAPPEGDDVPYFWYNAGGLLVNLAIICVSGLLLFLVDLPIIPFSLCIMLLATGGWLFIMNAVPVSVGGVPNDGKNILTLWRHPEQRINFRNMLAVAAEQGCGRRLMDMPEQWFGSEPLTKKSSVMEMSARNLTYMRLMDEMRFDEARSITEEFTMLGNAVPQLFQMEIASDGLLLELLTKGREDVVDRLWTKKQQRYVKAYAKYMPLKVATLFAYEFIHNHDAEAARKYHDELIAKQDKYTQPGEARMAIALIEWILANK